MPTPRQTGPTELPGSWSTEPGHGGMWACRPTAFGGGAVKIASLSGRPYRPPLQTRLRASRRGGLYARPDCTPALHAPSPNARIVGARMARPYPAAAITGAGSVPAPFLLPRAGGLAKKVHGSPIIFHILFLSPGNNFDIINKKPLGPRRTAGRPNSYPPRNPIISIFERMVRYGTQASNCPQKTGS